MYLGVERRETIRLQPTNENLKYASNLRAEIQRKITLETFNYGDYFPNSKLAKISKPIIPTFSESAKSWLAIIKAEKTESAYETYRKYLTKNWLPIYGDRPIDSILTSEIKETLAELDVSAKTKNNMLIPVRGILSAAYYDGIIKENPTDRIKNLKHQKPEPDPFTLDEIEQILAYMADRYDEQILNYFEFAFFTGLRPPNEMIALQWRDVEKSGCTVRRAKVLGKLKETKTYTVRKVEFNDRALTAITRQRKHTSMKSDYVFTNPVTGNAWADGRAQATLYYYPTLKALRIKEREPYQTRHSFATMMLMNAEANPMWVSQQMGHKNMQMLLNVYAKWIALADKSREVNKVNSAILGNNKRTKTRKNHTTT